MRPLVVLNVVGLARRDLADAPRIAAIGASGFSAPLTPVFPAVTCPVQATFLTGQRPSGHGIVGNGWYEREPAQVFFWRQSNRLVRGEKVYETGKRRDAAFTCAKLFWWFNMYGAVEWSVTPRPIYPADGRKIPEIYSSPADLGARLSSELGPFAFVAFVPAFGSAG